MTPWQPVPGTVYIVGGGPGDPDLMTVRARTVLAAAQTVLYADSLVDPQLFDTVAELKDAGQTIVLVEQYLTYALRFADICYVLAKGSVVFVGEPDELRDSEALASSYLGAG